MQLRDRLTMEYAAVIRRCPQSERAHSASLQAQLQNDSTLRTLLSVYLPQHTLVSQAIKVQFNEGKFEYCKQPQAHWNNHNTCM